MAFDRSNAGQDLFYSKRCVSKCSNFNGLVYFICFYIGDLSDLACHQRWQKWMLKKSFFSCSAGGLLVSYSGKSVLLVCKSSVPNSTLIISSFTIMNNTNKFPTANYFKADMKTPSSPSLADSSHHHASSSSFPP